MIKCVVFDMAGTTVKDYGIVGKLLLTVLRGACSNFTMEEVNSLMGTSKTDTIRGLLESRVEPIHNAFIQEMRAYYKLYAEEIPGATETFRALRAQGIKVALNTGFPRAIAEVIIDKLNWADEIDFSICSDEVTKGRPWPYMIHEICDALEVKPSEIMKVGDTTSDVQEALNVGCQYIVGTSYGTDGESLLEKFPSGTLVMIHDILEVIELIQPLDLA